MIVYFADRQLNILGQATTGLPGGLVLSNDRKTGDVETGVDVFECKINFDKDTRLQVEAWAEVGNYILLKSGNDTEFYTIIDSECNAKKQTMYIYVEDAGLDLLNEVVGEYEADKAYPIAHYIEKFAYDSGFRIGINEVSKLTRKLSWDGEQTVTARLASVATQFDGCEISYSFDIKGLQIVNKYINIHKKRGSDDGVTLWLNKDIDNIITTKSIANIATALRATGGTPEDAENPITLRGYKYDDGDFYIDGDCLKSRNGLKKWSRYLNPNEPNKKEGHEGHIVRLYSYDTTEQATLLAHTLTELKKLLEIEVNYEVDIMKLPDNVRVGDRINIVDEAGELYLSTRILQLETSVADQTQKATLGEHLIRSSGIHQKVADLAAQFAKTSQSAARALVNANKAAEAATAAQEQADNALADAGKAQQAAAEAATAAKNAQTSADNAQKAADNAQAAVDSVENSVERLDTKVTNAQAKADSAQIAADTAQQKADEAAASAAQALADAADANAAVVIAQGKAEEATTKANEAQSTADTAKTNAATAQATADAAKLDAEKAKQDIASLGEELETVSTTMQADYARKTDLTEATASLQTQITQNAAQISSTATKVQEIDETANNAKDQAAAAQSAADAAQSQADQATADAAAAKTAADNAATAASNAQTEADNAKAAAAAAQSAADKADADLTAAKADLASVTSRVDATEEEITAAQKAVQTAQAAADKAKQDADTAAEKATQAQQTADTAVSNASTAQQAANDAASKADLAQQAADAAKGDAATAQAKAEEAATAAANAQATANTAKTNAANAQAKADQAAADAATAQKAADDADAKAAQAAADLATAEQNLANVTNRVGATEEEIAAAQAAVETAQEAADKAKADAATAQSTADTAKANAATAQTAANNAKTAADNAQTAANEAKQAADDAQADVDALAVRVTTAETKITQNAEAIELRATKTEVAQTLGGYYTKTEADAAMKVKADAITATVSKDYAKTVSRGEQLITNGNGQLGDNTNFSQLVFDGANANNSPGSFTWTAGARSERRSDEYFPINPEREYTLSIDAKSSTGAATIYAFFDFYDIDKKVISAQNHMYLPGTLTTLAQDLKPGDTVAHLADVSAWVYNKVHFYYLSLWNYTNSFGYTYPPETYTRNRITLANTSNKITDGAIDYENNTLTLASAWTGSTIPAGTSVSQGGLGATYKYLVESKQLSVDWQTFTGIIRGVDNSGQNVSKTFPPGVAYARICFLWNWNQSTDQLWVTNISVTDTTAATDAKTEAIDEVNATLKTYATKSEVTQTANSITTSVSATYATKTALASTDTKAANAATAAANAQADIDGLEVGGRNLLQSSMLQNVDGNSTKEFTAANWAGTVVSSDNIAAFIEPSTEYTVSYTAELVAKTAAPTPYANTIGFVLCSDTVPSANVSFYADPLSFDAAIGDKTQCTKTFVTPDTIPSSYYVRMYTRRWTTDGAAPIGVDTVKFTDFKWEKGNKATDWTPAPEDVDANIEASAANLTEMITEQRTSILQDSESITLTALESYVEKSEYEENREEVQAQLKLQSDTIEMNFTASSEQIGGVNDDLQEWKNHYGRHISFSGDTAISITTSDGKAGVEIDPVSGIALKNDGEVKTKIVGDDLYTGNMVVEVNKRAQFGPIAFVPRSDGSLAILKVK